MTAPLHDLLDDLASSQRLDRAALAERSWVDGRARRRRRRLLHAAAAVAAALVGLLVLGPLAAVAPRDLPGPSFAGSLRWSTATRSGSIASGGCASCPTAPDPWRRC